MLRRSVHLPDLPWLHPVSTPFIAIVDDHDVLCSSLVDLMRSIGYRAEPFGSAEAFLASSSLFLFDCIVADVHLPGMSGLDLVRTLREHGTTTPAILITALIEKRLDDAAISVGAVCLLRKPLDIKVLVELIERNLQ